MGRNDEVMLMMEGGQSDLNKSNISKDAVGIANIIHKHNTQTQI